MKNHFLSTGKNTANINPIVFFDGVCGLCNRAVDLLIRLDKKNIYKFAPLQGKTAQTLLNEETISKKESVVLYDQRKIYKNSTAVIYILIRLGGLWKTFYIFFIIPAFIRDYFYRQIANNRYKWFSIHKSCRLPTPDEVKKFLP
jgi:predicted DCC family thiol-disulfide oxidoreductase YuxK